MKTLKYQWFNKERGKYHRNSTWIGVALYFAGFAAWFFSFAELLMAHFVNTFFFALAGIWLFIMFAVFAETANSIRIRDMLDRIYFRTPENFERYKKRVMLDRIYYRTPASFERYKNRVMRG